MAIAAALPIAGIVMPVIEKIFDRFFPDPEKKNEAIKEFYTLLSASDLAQMEVNRTEAASASVFTSGWRPAVGWICALALFYQYIAVPIGMWALTFKGIVVDYPPTLDGNLWELLFGMLGLGAMRTFEKLKGIAK